MDTQNTNLVPEVPTNEQGKALTSQEIKANLDAEANKAAEEAKNKQEDVEDKGEVIEKEDKGKEDEEEDDVLDSLFKEEKEEVEDKGEEKKKENKEEDDDEIAEDDAKLVAKVVEDKLREKEDKERASKALQQEIVIAEKSFDDYVEKNPEVKKYSENIKPYVGKLYDAFVKTGIKLSDGSTIKIPEGKYNDFVTSFILGRGMLKLGARMKAAADKTASADSQSGNGIREGEGLGGFPDVKNLSREEFKKLQMKIETGNFKA